ncbi:MAG: hypothetical protein WD009_14025 [Phycisphaeraceae bacterium]
MPEAPSTVITITPLLLSRAQTCAVMGGIDESTLDRLERRGAIGPRPVRLGGKGGRVLYPYHELQDWIEAGCPDRVAWDHLLEQPSNGPETGAAKSSRKRRSAPRMRNGDGVNGRPTVG